MSIKILFFSIILSAILFTGYAQDSTLKSISVEQLNESINLDSNLVILDVRNVDELTGPLGEIKGAINIPLLELESKLYELEKFRNKDIAVICRSGRRSAIATGLLVKKGFNAENVLGGMTEYRKEEMGK